MNIDDQKKSMARTMTVLPRMLNYLKNGFKPEFDIPIKKSELKLLFEMDIHPNMPMKHYVEIVNMESGSFTYLADKMEKKGLIKREQSEEDKRITILKLTDKGQNITELMHDKFDMHLTELIGNLDSEVLDDLNQAAKLLSKALDKLESKKTK